MSSLQARTLWSTRKQFGLVPKLSHDTNTKSIFWEALVFLPTHPIWCSAGLNSRTASFFVLYINDLPQCLENCSINMYANDIVLYFTSLCSSEINKVVHDDLNRVEKWIECNKLILNYSKTKTMLFGSRQNLAKSPTFCIQLHGMILEKVPKFSYLGVFLDETLSWKDHVEYVSSKVSSRLGLLSRIRACLTLEASKQVYASLVQPLFDYADVAWGEISEGCCKELQRLQNRAARIILRRKTSKNAFHLLNWLSLACRRKLHKCSSVFKCLNNLVLKY